jgi:cellulose synthase/poly-beta-1,6-N-acetylglucosamine synthase-like glycosyltransferase
LATVAGDIRRQKKKKKKRELLSHDDLSVDYTTQQESEAHAFIFLSLSLFYVLTGEMFYVWTNIFFYASFFFFLSSFISPLSTGIPDIPKWTPLLHTTERGEKIIIKKREIGNQVFLMIDPLFIILSRRNVCKGH